MTLMHVERFDTRLDGLLPIQPQVEALCTGMEFCEGPVWDSRKSLLYFTDFLPLKIYTWSPSGGKQLFCEESGREVGLTLDREGRLLGCASRWQAISRREPDGTITRLNNEIHGTGLHLNNPNDLVVKSDGCIYLSDPYNPVSCPPRSVLTNGVYRLDPVSGRLDSVVEHMERPNGLCFSPDESLLYINDTNSMLINVHEVHPDGSLDSGRLFAKLDPAYGPGAPDGMKCDRHGNVYLTGPGGIWIFAADGTPLGILRLDERAGNLAWGGDDWSDLFVTASTTLYRIPMTTYGMEVLTS